VPGRKQPDVCDYSDRINKMHKNRPSYEASEIPILRLVHSVGKKSDRAFSDR